MSHVLSVFNGEQMAHNKEMNEQEAENDAPETHRFSSRPVCLERIDYKYDTHDCKPHPLPLNPVRVLRGNEFCDGCDGDYKQGSTLPTRPESVVPHFIEPEFKQMGSQAECRSFLYFKPSFFPAARRAIDSRMRFSRVSGRLAK
jgi:hypothetical protein